MKNSRFVFVILLLISCNKIEIKEEPPPLPSEKSILEFSFKIIDNPSISADIVGLIRNDTISLTIPNTSNTFSFIPTIVFSGNSINPKNKTAVNFSSPVNYEITALDGSTKNYIIIVKKESTLSSEKLITAFTFSAADNPAIIADIVGIIRNDTIHLTIPNTSNSFSFIPTILFSGSSITPKNKTIVDFSVPINYVITALDGSSRKYLVIVKKEPLNVSATLYINSNSFSPSSKYTFFYAINTTDGTLNWKYETPTRATGSGLEFSKGILFGGHSNNFIALDTITKQPKWTFQGGAWFVSFPIINNKVLYVSCDDDYLYALDEFNGTLKWKYLAKPTGSSLGPLSSPTIVNGVIYVASSDGAVHAIDASTGFVKWVTPSPFLGINSSSPSVVNNTVYQGGGKLFAMDAETGAIKWVFKESTKFNASPTIVNDVIYIGSQDNYFYAINALTGDIKWKFLAQKGIYTSAVVQNGLVYFATTGSISNYVNAVNIQNGEIKWTYFHDYPFDSSPIFFNDRIFIASSRAVMALDAITGVLKWERSPVYIDEGFRSSPTIVDKNGNVYFSSLSGAVQ